MIFLKFFSNPLTFYGIVSVLCIFIYLYFYFKDRRKKNTEDSFPDQEVADPLEDLAISLDIPLPLLKTKLDIPLTGVCLAETKEEARERYYASKNGSDEEFFALKKWIEMEDSLEQFPELYKQAKRYDGSFREEVIIKWNAVALKKAKVASSEAQLKDLYYYTFANSEAEIIVIKKLFVIYQKKGIEK